jgi:hypothetical protein
MPTKALSLEEIFNRVNDWDVTWIGFRRLKPARHENMPVRTVSILSSLLAPSCGMAIAVCLWLAGAERELCWAGAFAGAVQFVFLQSMSAYFWNRRAVRLRTGMLSS